MSVNSDNSVVFLDYPVRDRDLIYLWDKNEDREYVGIALYYFNDERMKKLSFLSKEMGSTLFGYSTRITFTDPREITDYAFSVRLESLSCCTDGTEEITERSKNNRTFIVTTKSPHPRPHLLNISMRNDVIIEPIS